jgi:hypothetical protein
VRYGTNVIPWSRAWRRREERRRYREKLLDLQLMTPQCGEGAYGGHDHCGHGHRVYGYSAAAPGEMVVGSCPCRCHESCPACGLTDYREFERTCICPGRMQALPLPEEHLNTNRARALYMVPSEGARRDLLDA